MTKGNNGNHPVKGSRVKVEPIKSLKDIYLFLGQRGRLTVPSVNRQVKQWCAAINLKGNYGAHTLRKTFVYIQ